MPVPEWGLRVVMVVRQRQRGLGRDAGAAQRREEALRIADAGRGGHARPAGERRQRTGRAALDLARVAGFQPHPGLARRAAGAASGGPGTPTLVTTASTSRSRLAGSRSGRPAAGGHCRSRARPAPRFHVARQRQVLQAVVRDDHVHVGMRAQQRLGSQRALGMHRDRRAAGARDQGGLVAECRRSQRRALSDARLGADLRAVASADHARIEAARAQSSTVAITMGVLPVPPT